MSQQLENIDEQLANHKLSQEDYKHIKEILGREPNLVELGIFSAMWSEHCSYKSSKVHLKGFRQKLLGLYKVLEKMQVLLILVMAMRQFLKWNHIIIRAL